MSLEIIYITDENDERVASFKLRPPRRISEGDEIVIDSEKVVLRALDAGIKIKALLATQTYYDRHHEMLVSKLDNNCTFYCLEKKLMETIVGHRIHQAIQAVAERPKDTELAELGPKILVLDRLLDIQNVGAIIRSCHAFGVDSVMVHPTGCSPFGRRAVRVSMGSIFQMKIWHSQDFVADLEWLKDTGGYQIVATANSTDAVSVRDAEFSSRGVMVIGNEDQGIGELISSSFSDLKVKIPVAESIDSLNAACAAAVLLFAWSSS